MTTVYEFTPRYYEVDMQGVMFNAWYLGYVDEAMNHHINYPRKNGQATRGPSV